MHKEEDNYLNRRVAFWDNWYRDFECAKRYHEVLGEQLQAFAEGKE